MELLFSCLTRYLTRSLRLLVRCRVEHLATYAVGSPRVQYFDPYYSYNASTICQSVTFYLMSEGMLMILSLLMHQKTLRSCSRS